MSMTLVTGASGFVGSHLIKEMTQRGLAFRGVTRGTLPGLMTIPSYGPEMDWSYCLDGIETVIHLAARVHVMRETASDPLTIFREANVTATVNLARQAAAAGVRRFVFVSSIKVNGERTDPGKPFTAADPRSPQDPYGISKAEAEVAILALGRETGMEVTIVRPPLVYGPGVRGNFKSLMKWAASGLPSIFAAVKNERSFVHVDNLCDLLLTVLDHPNAINQVFLVSDRHDLSTNDLLLLLLNRAGRSPRSLAVPTAVLLGIATVLRKQTTGARLLENLQVDVEHTCDTLGWRPPLSLIDTMKHL